MLTEPRHEGGGSRFLVVALAVVAVLVAAALAFWLFARRPAEPKGPPPLPRARTSPRFAPVFHSRARPFVDCLP